MADLTLDTLIVKKAAEGHVSAPPDDVVRSSPSVNVSTWPNDMPVRCWVNHRSPDNDCISKLETTVYRLTVSRWSWSRTLENASFTALETFSR